MSTHFDVLIIGAGLSGIGAACHLQRDCPGKTYAILEGRQVMGGTWDLFRYPGVRSDSDMFTLGYVFRPWREAKSIADGASILNYIRETAEAHGIDRKIRYGHRVRSASWSSADAAWTVEVDSGADPLVFTCRFLFTCTGYYDYADGYVPEFPGRARFVGRIVHPQQWPEDLDYAGKRVVVIGSGATAITLVPAMAKTAGHVTMLQRSPTYVVSLPAEDRLANRLRQRLPAGLAYRLIRWRNVLLGMFFYELARRRPERMKARILGWARRHLGPDYDVVTHFTPRYNPWDQRLCLVPDADLFRAIRDGRVSVATDQIETFTETGIRLRSGATLPADVIVTATGFQLQLMSGMRIAVDGDLVDLSKALTYKGFMYGNVPNLASAFGYTNASWTLKSDLTSGYVCRLLNYMDRHGYVSCTPHEDGSARRMPLLSFTSSYVRRGIGQFPEQGEHAPWRVRQNYLLDLIDTKLKPLDDGVMRFARAAPASRA
ncbi:MAG TPA: NAD(P)/FAD-dependent oxidoreductase [Aliidongia sp.]|nr:NAD(P)/FAD-dependent oxidoreductase [Aliidongia sp.]